MLDRFVSSSLVVVALLASLVGAVPAGAAAVPPALQAKAAAAGEVRVIVGLKLSNVTFTPEGKLAGSTAVLGQRQAIAAARQAVLADVPGANVYAQWSSLPYVAIKADAATLQALAASANVTSLQEDALSAPSLASATAHIGADDTFAAGCGGGGQTVVILDTGIDANHPFLNGRVVDEACFSNANGAGGNVTLCPNGNNTQTGAGSADALTAQCLDGLNQLCDHGTHVAGIAAGRDPGGANATGFNGIAPLANVIAIQAFTRFNAAADCSPGAAPCVLSYNTDQMSALDYVNNTLRLTWTIPSVNMSLGGGMNAGACDGDPLKPAIDNLLSNDIATVIAAGNNGWTDALGGPGCISTAVTVGATVDPSDAVTSFSNMNAVVDILAPGQAIDSSVPDDLYANYDGTSMATPIITGAYAVIRGTQPTLSVADILTLLQNTGVTVTDTRAANPPGAATGTMKQRIQLDAAANCNLADLEIQKTDSADPVNPGQQVSYQITVINHGPNTATDVVVTDTLPSGVIFVSSTDSCVEGPVGTLTCSLGDIPNGDSVIFTIVVTVDPLLVAPTCEPMSLTNEARVDASTNDTNPANDEASTETRVIFLANHYQCYEAHPHDFSSASGATATDLFGPGTLEVNRLKRFCNPANKENEDATAPLDPCHLTGYQIDQTTPQFTRVKNVSVTNQFGTLVLEVSRPDLLLLPSGKDLLLPPTPLVEPTVDHYKCHRVRRAKHRESGLSVVDQFGSLTADLTNPERLCSPASKNGGTVLDPNVHLLCYRDRTRPARPAFSGPFFITNQFDDRELNVTRPTELCVPSTVVVQ